METAGSCNVLVELHAGVPSVVGCDDSSSSVLTQRSGIMENCWLLRNELGEDCGETPAENEDAPESGEQSRGKKVDNGVADELVSDEDDSESDDSDDDSVDDGDTRDIYMDDDDDDDSEDDDDDDSEDDDDDDDDEDMDSEDEDSGSEDDD